MKSHYCRSALVAGLFSLFAIGAFAAPAASPAPKAPTMPSAASTVVQLPDLIEAALKTRLESLFKIKIDSLSKSPIGELYEVVTRDGVAYTDKKGEYIVTNAVIFNTITRENITQATIDKITAMNFSKFPLIDAIKTVHGKGTRHLVTFEDPNCGYCKKLSAVMAEMDDLTVYTFLLPILGDDSVKTAHQIWCSVDRAAAWSNQMVKSISPIGKDDCDTSAIERNEALAAKLRIHGTPALFFSDDTRTSGAMELLLLEKKLNTAK
jgi:thiol:disulfide interchange protein DsbC